MMGLSWASESLKDLGIRNQKRSSAESQLGYGHDAFTTASQRAAPTPMTRNQRVWDDLRITAPPAGRMQPRR